MYIVSIKLPRREKEREREKYKYTHRNLKFVNVSKKKT